MKRVLFVCHGNICRSPMAELILRDMTRKEGLQNKIFTASAATSGEETGNPVYPLARKILASHGISADGKTAMQLTRADYERYDLIIGMDAYNIRNILRITGGDAQGKVFRLLDLSDRPRDIADPWYTGDFERTWTDISEGCALLLEKLRAQI